jgi:hypothetical protein
MYMSFIEQPGHLDVSEDERDYSTFKSKDVANIMHIKKM